MIAVVAFAIISVIVVVSLCVAAALYEADQYEKLQLRMDETEDDYGMWL